MFTVQAVTYCLQGDLRFYHFYTEAYLPKEEQTNLLADGWTQK